MNLYDEYYREITDKDGKITSVETSFDDGFNFAYDVMDKAALLMPDDIALVHKSAEGKERRFTFLEMKTLSDKAANLLSSLGIQKHDPVMLLLKRRYEYWISILAIHKLGAVAIPTSHMVSDEDIKERAVKAGAKAIICVNTEGICEKVYEGTKDLDMVRLSVGEKCENFLDFDFLMDISPSDLTRVATSAHDDMLYYFTSGTSGEPKAVIHDFSYPIAHIYTAKNWHGIKKGDLHLTVADSGWAKSAWGKLYGQWFMGAAIMVYDYEQFYASDMLKLLEDEKINTFCAPPTIYKYLVLEDLTKFDLSSLRCVTTAGEPMPSDVAEKFKKMTGLSIREGFGQTETALQICMPVGGAPVDGSIGKASPLYNLDIVDEEGKSVPSNEEGEIVIIPKNNEIPIGVFKGYLFDEDLYKEVWEGGIYHTKDKARKDEDGNFFFIGRNDDVIKSSGYRIGPSEVEDILMLHPAVFECAVTGYPSKNRGSLVKASIVLNEGYEGSAKLATELQDFVKKRAAIYKYPRMVKFVDSLPHTTNGKINRAAIRKADMSK